MKILITGGCGFIGSNFINNFYGEFDSIINVDKITYAGNESNIKKDIRKDKNYTFIKEDICNPDVQNLIKDVDCVVHMAAESHVDNSIKSGKAFVETNVLGTYNILEGIRKYNKYCVSINTDELMGPVNFPADESAPINPKNPYSATKASAELLGNAYANTYGCRILSTRCCNNMGPNQHNEKFIPTIIRNILTNNQIPVYGDGKQSREWIHVYDHCDKIVTCLTNQLTGKINIGSGYLIDNISLIECICKKMGVFFEDYIEYVKDRPGHDIKYHLDSNNMSRYNPTLAFDFNRMLDDTINFYRGIYGKN